MNLRESTDELAIGINYCTALGELARPPWVDVVEVEPQTVWIHAKGGAPELRVDEDALAELVAVPAHKVLHGVGFPIGGTCAPDPIQLAPLREMIAALAPAWLSEHLAFNAVDTGHDRFDTAFLLPPRQTAAGVRAAADSIDAFVQDIAMPFAIENGVNYWRPRADELPDGAFVAEVLEAADCGLVLDLHNAWTNERNGRQSVADFLAQLPLERVWELHLAGGESRHGLWIDGHNDVVPPEVIAHAAAVIPRCPNLRLVVFEVFPNQVPRVGLDRIAAQLTALRGLPKPVRRQLPPGGRAPTATPSTGASTMPTPVAWEHALARLVVGDAPRDALQRELADDPGLTLVRELLGEFRSAMVVANLPLSCRLVMLHRGAASLAAAIAEHGLGHAPEKFAVSEALATAEHLAVTFADVPCLPEVLRYELGVLRALLHRETVTVAFEHDPLPLLRTLARGELPGALDRGRYEVQLTP